mmetsp:Transcript_24253/g.73988  ORF Transcript_24253/g.73988 Transcript_24253/m.73988 type:complete len:226 (-) Transcript_24253:21-698(-)
MAYWARASRVAPNDRAGLRSGDDGPPIKSEDVCELRPNWRLPVDAGACAPPPVKKLARLSLSPALRDAFALARSRGVGGASGATGAATGCLLAGASLSPRAQGAFISGARFSAPSSALRASALARRSSSLRVWALILLAFAWLRVPRDWHGAYIGSGGGHQQIPRALGDDLAQGHQPRLRSDERGLERLGRPREQARARDRGGGDGAGCAARRDPGDGGARQEPI